MPRIIGYNPPWLLDAALTSNLSSHRDSSSDPNPTENAASLEPRRTIARRGTEIFIAEENQIRWADLSLLKNAWEERMDSGRREAKGTADYRGYVEDQNSKPKPWKILKLPVHGAIKQLVPSPNGEWLAICTTYTVHIAVLPDLSRLRENDAAFLRPKTYQLGPTSHVTTQSPVVSALWHPLGVSGNTLVTVTADATVRLWELSRENHWSFDRPSLAFDMKKLADATSLEDDLAPSGYGQSKGFSPDSFDMEVAAACFGGSGSADENGWNSMTLWIAMRTGDVYALCPLVPSRLQLHPNIVSILYAETLSKYALQHDTAPPCNPEQSRCNDQYQWLSALGDQDIRQPSQDVDFADNTYLRPDQPGPVPILQGPFQIRGLDEDIEVTDIYAMAAGNDELLMETESFEDSARLTAPIVCLLTSEGEVHVCLNLESIEPDWLPKKESLWDPAAYDLETSSLTVFVSLNTTPKSKTERPTWPTFTPDQGSDHSFLVTHSWGVAYVSLSSWLEKVGRELQTLESNGSNVRIQNLVEDERALVELPIKFDANRVDVNESATQTACVVFRDSNLGYLLLTALNDRLLTVVLDASDLQPDLEDELGPDVAKAMDLLVSAPPREAYQPPSTFWSHSALTTFFDAHVPLRHKKILEQEIRLSPATLEQMTMLHRILSEETHQLGLAAADLFVRCERLRDEFKEQIRQVEETSVRVDRVTNELPYEISGEDGLTMEAINRRIQTATTRQRELVKRYDALRRKMTRTAKKDLNEKEKSWIAEIDKMSQSLFGSEKIELQKENSLNQNLEIEQRYDTVRTLAQQFLLQAENKTSEPTETVHDQIEVPFEIRRASMNKVKEMLERETALVLATVSRLKQLDSGFSI